MVQMRYIFFCWAMAGSAGFLHIGFLSYHVSLDSREFIDAGAFFSRENGKSQFVKAFPRVSRGRTEVPPASANAAQSLQQEVDLCIWADIDECTVELLSLVCIIWTPIVRGVHAYNTQFFASGKR